MNLNERLLKAVYEELAHDAFNYIRAIDDADIRQVSAPFYVLSAADEQAKAASRKLVILLLTVNMEKRALTRQLQMALNEHLGERWSFKLAVDGLIGPATAAAFSGYTADAMINIFNQLSRYLLEVDGK